MDVFVILRHDPSSYNSSTQFAAVAKDEAAARKWIQDEVDEKHDTNNHYCQGKSVDWWLNYGLFSFHIVPLH